MNNATSFVIQQSTDGGVTWTTAETLTDPTLESYAMTGLTQGTSYEFRITAANPIGGPSSPSTATTPTMAPVAPRYVVIDLGPNFVPTGLNSSGVVVGNGTNGYGAQVWGQGVLSPLSTNYSGWTKFSAVGIDDAGQIAGNMWHTSPVPTNSVVNTGCYWANTNAATAPIPLGATGYAPGGPPNNAQVTAMSGGGFMVGYVDQFFYDAVQFNPAWTDYSTNYWNGTNWQLPCNDPAAKGSFPIAAAGAANWCGNANGFHAGPPVINGTTYTNSAYTSIATYGINSSNWVVGAQGGNALLITNASGGTLMTNNLGPGLAVALNDATTTNVVAGVTNVTYTPQIVGVDGTGTNAMLWSYTQPDGTPTNSIEGIKLNQITFGVSGVTTPPVVQLKNPFAINLYSAFLAQGTSTPLNTDGSRGTPVTKYYLGTPVKVTWETIGSNTPIDDNNDPITGLPMPGGGKRIYPDKLNPTDMGGVRNKVTLRVNAGATAAGWKVYVQAYDVDDPTPDSVDVDINGNHHIIDSNDTATVKQGNDNLSDPEGIAKTGFFTDSTTASDNAILDSTGQATFEFNVGYQPGDNYRVAVTFLKSDDLSNLQVTNSNNPYYVTPNSTIPDGFTGAMSSMLTVWRRLWIEQDSMAAVPTTGDQKNFLTGNITAIARDTPTTGQSTVTTDTLFWDDANRFEHGTITINGTAYPVVSNTNNEPNPYYPDQVVITGTPSDAAVVGKSFTIVDDDEYGLPSGWSPLMPRFGIVTSSLVGKFSPAYILVVDAASYNTNPTVPFYLNDESSSDMSASKDLTTSTTCWIHLVVAAYQPNQSEDGDPNSESVLVGGTFTHLFSRDKSVSAIWLEAIREDEDLNLRNPSMHSSAQAGYLQEVINITAHETGHTPGNQTQDQDHAEGGIMAGGGLGAGTFTAPSLLRFRKSQTWNGD